MTVFEFVFGLFSIVLSLALTHLLAGVAGLIRNRKRVTFSGVHALWMWAFFAITVGNWAALWPFHHLAVWPAWSILLNVFIVVGNYLVCYLVTPETPSEGPIDLVEFHRTEGRSYLGAVLMFGLLALPANMIFGATGQFSDWLRDSALTFVGMSFMLLPFLVKARWAQVTGAVASALLATFFMVLATNIATT